MNVINSVFFLICLFCSFCLVQNTSVIHEPFPWIHNLNKSGSVIRGNLSPDPFVDFTWNAGNNFTQLQLYNATVPVSWSAKPASSFKNLDTLAAGKANISVLGSGSIFIDFGVERAGWLEFESPDISEEQARHLRASISEYNEPWDGKTRQVIGYSNGVFRLETNPELYEGVRYVWVYVDTYPNMTIDPWHISAVRLVSRVKAVNYTGYFVSSDDVLSGAWWTGSYSSRLNMEDSAFNSILMDRGDRVSIQGDGHPTMAAALSAFGCKGTFDLVRLMLNKTDSGFVHGHQVIDQGIMPYPIYWGMSVNDYYFSSGNTEAFLNFAPDVGSILDQAALSFLQDGLNVGWFGWDDRLGNGFCGSCNIEAQLGFATLVVRAVNDFALSLKYAGDPLNATKYAKLSLSLTERLRNRTSKRGPLFYDDYGLHAAANLINARVVNLQESDNLFRRLFNDPVNICSWSNFNQYYILQAVGNLGKRNYAVSMIRLCWGRMTPTWDKASRWGKGCFWELSSPEWTYLTEGDKAPTRPSYCHPWSNGVTHWLSESFGGILALEPGYKRVAVLPHMSDMSKSTNVSVGPVQVFASRGDLDSKNFVRVIVQVQSKQNIDGKTSYVGLPKVEEGTACELKEFVLQSSPSQPTVPYSEHTMERLHPILGSKLRFLPFALVMQAQIFEATYFCSIKTYPSLPCKGINSCPPFANASYPGTWNWNDKYKGGDWMGRFGGQGYVLFGFNNGSDVQKLPSWVNSVNIFKGTTGFVGADTANKTFLQNPDSQDNGRALGFVTAGSDGSQGTVLDINVTQPRKAYNITLYFVESVKPKNSSTWSATRQAIRTLDLESMNVIASEPYIDNMSGGVYWTLSYNNSVRLRVMPIDSDAGFCAVFIDT